MRFRSTENDLGLKVDIRNFSYDNLINQILFVNFKQICQYNLSNVSAILNVDIKTQVKLCQPKAKSSILS